MLQTGPKAIVLRTAQNKDSRDEWRAACSVPAVHRGETEGQPQYVNKLYDYDVDLCVIFRGEAVGLPALDTMKKLERIVGGFAYGARN